MSDFLSESISRPPWLSPARIVDHEEIGMNGAEENRRFMDSSSGPVPALDGGAPCTD
jgi:hypothetical protein